MDLNNGRQCDKKGCTFSLNTFKRDRAPMFAHYSTTGEQTLASLMTTHRSRAKAWFKDTISDFFWNSWSIVSHFNDHGVSIGVRDDFEHQLSLARNRLAGVFGDRLHGES